MPDAAPTACGVYKPRRRLLGEIARITDGTFRPDGTFVSWRAHDTNGNDSQSEA